MGDYEMDARGNALVPVKVADYPQLKVKQVTGREIDDAVKSLIEDQKWMGASAVNL